MVLSIRSLPFGHSQQRVSFTPSTKDDREWPKCEKPLVVECSCEKTATEVFIVLCFSGVVSSSCARCMRSFPLSITGTTEVVAVERAQCETREAGDDDAMLVYDAADEEIDLSGVLYDELMVSLPMMPLCSSSCRGVDSVPGSGSDESDSRWAPLAKLKERLRAQSDDKEECN